MELATVYVWTKGSQPFVNNKVIKEQCTFQRLVPYVSHIKIIVHKCNYY